MELPDFIRLGQEEPPLRFLIIGGYAVAAHGHTRATFDVDFLVRQADREAWLNRLALHGLALFAQTRAFAQFSQASRGDGLDLMFVDESTFDPMWRASEERDFGDSCGRVPSLEHLLALKLHALKQGMPHRTGKDAEDVEILLRRNSIDLRQPHYQQLFLKYEQEKSTKPFFASCEINEAGPERSHDLDLPVADTFRSLPPQIPLAEVVRRSRELRMWFPQGVRSAEERWRAKTAEEFHL